MPIGPILGQISKIVLNLFIYLFFGSNWENFYCFGGIRMCNNCNIMDNWPLTL